MLIQNTVGMLNRPSAFSRMRQRIDRRKKENVVAQSAAAMYRRRAPAMVRHTFLQSTPRTAKYNNNAESPAPKTHDHTLRLPPRGATSICVAAITASSDTCVNYHIAIAFNLFGKPYFFGQRMVS